MADTTAADIAAPAPDTKARAHEDHAHHGKTHDYHIIDPSPWPLISSACVLLLAVGAVLFMHGGTWLVMGLGFLAVIYCMIGWWWQVIRESVVEKAHTPVVKMHLRYGMMLFIASEVMFFVAWFWAYFDAALFPDFAGEPLRAEALGGQWPPAGIQTFDPWHLPLLNTLILLWSGTAVTWAHHALIEGDRDGVKWGLISTVVLGVLFSMLQAYEYSHAAFGFGGNVYSSTFFMATGFHGFHVIVGTIFLAVCLARAMADHFTPRSHFGFEAAAWYWHFVDVVWLFLFAAIYVWGAGATAH